LFRRLSCLLLLLPVLLCSTCAKEEASQEGEGLREKTAGESVTVEVNSLAPAFAATKLGGGEVRLSDYVGNQVIVLEFWSIFCKSCLEEMPKIHDLYKKYADQGLAVLSINTDVFSDGRVKSVLDKAGIQYEYPVLRDTRQALAKAYNVELLPVTVIIDRSGWIRLYQEGYRPGDEEKFEDLIQKLLNAEKKEDVTLASKGGVTSFAPASGTQLIKEGTNIPQGVSKTPLDGPAVGIGSGKATALFFWSLYCRPCRAEFPNIEELHRKFAARGIQVCSVNVDSERFAPRVRKFLEPYPNAPCLRDWPEVKEAMLARMLGVSATPAVVVIDEKGRVMLAVQGHVDTTVLDAQLQNLSR
jgi:peroxiredoxin